MIQEHIGNNCGGWKNKTQIGSIYYLNLRLKITMKKNCIYYNQLNVSLTANGENYNIVFRVSNDGVGFRYEFSRDKEIFIEKDNSEVVFKNNGEIWVANGEKHNVGHLNLIEGNLPSILSPPVVYQNKQVVVSITESAIFDNAQFRINVRRGKLGFLMGKSKILNKHTSWRTIIVKNLNPPPLQDFFWLKPGKSLWDWRVLGHKTTDGFVYKQENESYIRFVDFHNGPVTPSGDDRTYPNLVTKELCHIQSDAKKSYYPETAVSACFINQIAGPLDQTNGWYNLNLAHKNKKVFEEISSTVVAENAKLVVYYSPLTVLPDAPDSYKKKSDLFEFVRKLPDSFDDMKVINDMIGESITVARSKDKEWFVGSLQIVPFEV